MDEAYIYVYIYTWMVTNFENIENIAKLRFNFGFRFSKMAIQRRK